MEQEIIRLFRTLGLGTVIPPLTQVSGGLMHRMYRVNTSAKSYAVKCLNPEIMKRPEAKANFARAERLESIIEKTDIPIVPALVINGRKMQCAGGKYFYIFDWCEGSITDWDHISDEQCCLAGNILGRIHSLDPESGMDSSHCEREPEAEESHIDWDQYTREALNTENEIAGILAENTDLLRYAERSLNGARKKLPHLCCISNGDMDPKNVMWDQGRPCVIDLECLDYGNPVSHVLELALQWSGITTCSLELSRIRAFFKGYLAACDNGFRDYAEISGLAYSWIEWLEYNIQRALGKCIDEDERQLGIEEAVRTLKRIQYIHDHEEKIRRELEQL